MGKGKAFLAKLLDLEEKPKPPPKPSAEPELPLNAFNNLSLQPNHRPSYDSRPSYGDSFKAQGTSHERQRHSYDYNPRPMQSPHPGFVGGFQPLPRPPPMPLPYTGPSLTMQHALRPADTPASGLGVPHTPHRPHSAPEVPPHRMPAPSHTPDFNYPSPNSVAPTTTGRPPFTPPKPQRKRASSTPPDPSAPPETQCSGVTKAGKRCTRQVKNGGPAYPGVERFCFQHTKDLLVPTGFYARRNGKGGPEWVEFADYIPSYLHPDTQVALRVEMEKARSQSDVEGYIYTFEIRESSASKTIQLKVGRAVNVVKRLNEWGKQCGSKEQVLRGWYPGSVGEDESLMKGRVILPDGGNDDVWCHRLERLVHLELADLAVNGAYLEPGWKAFSKGKGKARYNPKVDLTTLPTSPKKKGGGGGLGNGGNGRPCKDC